MLELAAEEYTIGWICALQEEFEAACRMLDDEFDGLEASYPNDDNTYVFGRIQKHNVVIGCLPSGVYGTTSAACVARDMVRSFPNLRFALMVGIGGGAPTPERDIRLGDVVVSEPKGEHGGVLQYDLGKRLSDGEFRRTGQLNAPPRVLLGAFPEVRRRHNDPRQRHLMTANLARMDDMPEYSRPSSDKLYRADYRHRSGNTCDQCDHTGLVERPLRPSNRAIAVHYGTIASGNTVMKDAAERDRYANDSALNVLCFEMEAAGLMNNFPCLVIRGICDYCDDHKNDEWHNYAALTAAAYARDLLGIVRPQKVASQPSWAGKIESLLGEVCEDVKEVLHHQRGEDDERLWQWVSPIDHFKTQIDKSRNRNPETRAGQWLLDSPEFEEFLSGRSKSLFCPGIPGAGKTVLTSVVVDYLLKQQKDSRSSGHDRIGIAFIYLDFKQQFELASLLGSILRQLAADDPSALDSIRKLHGCNKKSRSLPLSEIRDILHSVAPSFSRLFIVVDALDEAEQHIYEALLSEVFHLKRAHGANVFATSRHIPDIERKFEGAQNLEIHAADEDVRSYVDSYMSKLPRFVSQRPDLQEETRIGIVKAVGGMFLLVNFHLDSLVGSRSVTAFRDALARLPTGGNAYDHAYDLALDRIEGQVQNRRDLAIEVLSWVVCAREHLTTLQLRHALAVIAGSTHLDESNIPDMDDVISVCAGLVVVDPGRDIVRLVHYTAQEYFDREKKNRLPHAQSHLTTICLAYLSYTCAQHGNDLVSWRDFGVDQRCPFYRYAVMNWGYHARETLVFLPAVLDFLKCEVSLRTQRGLLGLSRRDYSSYHDGPQTGVTGLHVAAYFGILEAVRLLEDETGNDLKDSFGWTPLSWASFKGQDEVVTYLLDTGKVRTDPADLRSSTPLHLAALNGHQAVMELLLTRGCDVNARNGFRRTPLQITMSRGNRAAAELLLDHGAALSQSCSSYEKPTEVAIRGDHAAIIKLLLEKRQNELDKGLLLTDAAFVGSLAIMRFLIDECKVEVNSKDRHGQTSLLLALRWGHTEVIEFLLANDKVDLMAKDIDGQAPLHQAVNAGNMAAVKFLLGKDEVDPNSRDNAGCSALFRAVTNRHLSITQTLVKEENVNIDSAGEGGRTPLLQVASLMHSILIKVHSLKAEIPQYERNCSICTDRRADETQQAHIDDDMVRLEEYKAIFNLLVEKGADCEAEDDYGNTIESYRASERILWESY